MARGIVVFGLGVATSLAAGWFAFPRALYFRSKQPVGFHHKAHADSYITSRVGRKWQLSAE